MHLAVVVVVVVVLWLKDDVSTEAAFSTDRASVPAPDDEEDDVGVGALFVVRLVTGGDGTTNPPFLVPSSPVVGEFGAHSVRVKSSERRPIPTPLRSEKLALMLLFALDDEDDAIAVVVAPAVLTVAFIVAKFIVVVSVVTEVLLVVVVMVVKDGIAGGSGGGGGTTLVLEEGTGFLLFTMLLWWKNS